MRKLLLSGAGLLALSGLLSACDANVSSDAAEVNGSAISQQSVNGALNAIGADAGYRCIIESSVTTPQPVTGVGSSTYDAKFSAGVLLVFIQHRAIQPEIATLSLPEDTFARSVARAEVVAALTPQQGSTCTESGTASFAGLGASYGAELVGFQADQDALAAHFEGVPLTRAGVTAYQANHRSTTVLSCIQAIEVSSQAKAASLAGQIRAGGNFAAIAKANSLDTASAANGGQLGCIMASQLSSPLAPVVSSLTVGGVSAPVKFGSMWVILQVSSRPPESLTQVASQIVDAGASKVGAVITTQTNAARVTVDPAYGRWTKVSGSYEVLPRTGPAPSLLPSSAAVTPTASPLVPGA